MFGAQLRPDLQQAAAVEHRVGDVADVVDLALLVRGRPRRGPRRRGRRPGAGAAWPPIRCGSRLSRWRVWSDRVGGVLGDQVGDAVLAVDLGTAELLHRDLFAHRLGDDLRPGEEHARVLGHHDEVGQRGRVGAAAGRDAGEDRDLRHLARELDAGAEDAAVAGEGGVALLQAGAAGADEADHRRAGVAGHPHRADDRVGVDFAEAAAEEGRVLGVTEDRPAVDFTGARGDAVARASPARRGACWRRRCASAGSVPGSQSICNCPSGVSAGAEGGALTAVAMGGMQRALVGAEDEDGVVAAEAERVGDRDDGTVSVDNRFS